MFFVLSTLQSQLWRLCYHPLFCFSRYVPYSRSVLHKMETSNGSLETFKMRKNPIDYWHPVSSHPIKTGRVFTMFTQATSQVLFLSSKSWSEKSISFSGNVQWKSHWYRDRNWDLHLETYLNHPKNRETMILRKLTCDRSVILAWLFNAVEPEIVTTLLYTDYSVVANWKNLEDHYKIANKP